MTQERRIDRTPELWAELAGRTIVVAGPGEGGRQEFAQNLAHLAGLQKTEVHIGDRPETATGENFVILFIGMPQEDLTGKQEAGAESISADGCGVSRPGQGNPSVLSEVLDSLEDLSNADFAAAVVITDYSVFGKCFGRERTLREEELGYVCHTSAAEQSQFGMRLAEQLACRMAREDGVNIKVVRIPYAARSGDIQTGRMPDMEQAGDVSGDLIKMGRSGDFRKRLIEAVLYVLLHGEAGEIYSLPDMQASPVSRRWNDRSLSASADRNSQSLSAPAGGNDRPLSASAGGNNRSSSAPADRNGQSSSAAKEQNWQASPVPGGQNSPLSPIEIRPDTRKFEKLMERI